MLVKSALLALPLLAAAIPTKRDQLVFSEAANVIDDNVKLDLNELRLVQFAQDEPPV